MKRKQLLLKFSGLVLSAAMISSSLTVLPVSAAESVGQEQTVEYNGESETPALLAEDAAEEYAHPVASEAELQDELAKVTTSNATSSNPYVITITNSFEIDKYIKIPTGTYVNLVGVKGSNITITASDNIQLDSTAMAMIYSSGFLTLQDITMDANKKCRVIYTTRSLTLNEGTVITGGTITEEMTAARGAGIYFNAAQATYKLTINEGASVKNNSSSIDNTLGVGIYARQAVYMNGGEVSNNIGTGSGTLGGGMYTLAISYIYNGNISGNSLTGENSQGAGVYAGTNLQLLGGEVDISENTLSGAESQGAGVYLKDGATLVFSGKIVIKDNLNKNAQENIFLDAYTGSSSTYAPLALKAELDETSYIGFTVDDEDKWNGTMICRGMTSYTITSVPSYIHNETLGASENSMVVGTDYKYGNINYFYEEIVEVPSPYTGATVQADSVGTLQEYLNEASKDSTQPTTIQLTADIPVSAALEMPAGRYAVLESAEGKSLSISAETGVESLIEISGNLILKNITFDAAQKGGRSIKVLSGGYVTLEEGTVIKNGLCASENSLRNVQQGLGIYVSIGGTLEMNGGTITANSNRRTVTISGLGVYNAGTFTMTGGEISGNTDDSDSDNNNGRGVYGAGVYNSGTFEMSGGKITNNIAQGPGAGIYSSGNSAKAALSGNAEITDNLTRVNGGGVYAGTMCTFTMCDDVIISGNTSRNGAGIYFDMGYNTAFPGGGVIEGGTITDNHSKVTLYFAATDSDSTQYFAGNGAGVFLSSGTLTVNGGSITGNDTIDADKIAIEKQQGLGQGLYVNGGSDAGSPVLNLAGGVISGNKTGSEISGIYVANYACTDSLRDETATYSYGQPKVNVSGIPVVDDLILASYEPVADPGENDIELYPVSLTIAGSLTTGQGEDAKTADITVSKKTAAWENVTDSLIAVNGTNYEMTSQDIDALKLTGSPEAAFTGLVYGSETGKLTVEEIAPDLDLEASYPFESDGVEPEITVSVGDKTLTEDVDYTVSYGENDKAGEGAGTVSITGMGSYFGTYTASFDIEALDLSSYEAGGIPESAVYTGSAITPEVTVTDDAGNVLTENADYTVKYADNKALGTATVTITGIGNYTGTITKNFTITQEDGIHLDPETGKLTYYENGEVKEETGFVGMTGADGKTTWYYVVDGVAADGAKVVSGTVNGVNGSWYVVDGVIAASEDVVKTTVNNTLGWYYVNKSGMVDSSYTGFASNSNGKWYIEKGKVTFKMNSVIKDTTGAIGTKGIWYYVVGSQVKTGYTGVADYANANGWWYIKNGAVDFTANTVAKNKNGWWYVTGGKVQFGYTGVANYANANGWWYIRGGKVDFTYTGVAKNKNGWWRVQNGKVNFNFTGLASNSNGWWYLKGGKVQFSYTGIQKNSNGTWYVKGGKVMFSYSGKVTINGKTYTVKGGKVVG